EARHRARDEHAAGRPVRRQRPSARATPTPGSIQALARTGIEVERVRAVGQPRLRLAWLSTSVVALAVLAIGARWSHISAAPLDFALARLYTSFNMVRWYYIRGVDSAPAWQRRVALANFKQEPALEPPI